MMSRAGGRSSTSGEDGTLTGTTSTTVGVLGDVVSELTDEWVREKQQKNLRLFRKLFDPMQ